MKCVFKHGMNINLFPILACKTEGFGTEGREGRNPNTNSWSFHSHQRSYESCQMIDLFCLVFRFHRILLLMEHLIFVSQIVRFSEKTNLRQSYCEAHKNSKIQIHFRIRIDQTSAARHSLREQFKGKKSAFFFFFTQISLFLPR